MLNRVKENFMRRTAFCLKENGGYIEHLLLSIIVEFNYIIVYINLIVLI